MELRDLSDTEQMELSESRKKVEIIKSARAEDLKQKARSRWALDGDENTSFFHGYIHNRYAKSRVNGLYVNNRWCQEPNRIKEAIYNFFSAKFSEPIPSRPFCEGLDLKKLSPEDSDSLITPFTLTEVKDAIWDCGSEKAPGPDGFNFTFIKRFWDFLKFDFLNVLLDFYHNGKLSCGVGACFVTLIPKIPQPSNLNEFRPITLIGCIRKTISKVLANRLKKVISSIVSPTQSAFISNRLILDGPLILNEIISWLKKRKQASFILKIDFEKAFDTISWNFIFSVMSQMGFPQIWITWIQGIFKSTRASVLVNGSPTSEFAVSRGVPQGDPLSPFIFIIAMEVLSTFTSKLTSIGLLPGIKLPNGGPIISQLLYADDVIFLGNWDLDGLGNIKRLMRIFHLISGLRINYKKTSLIPICYESNLPIREANPLNCLIGSLPFKYLGIMVGGNMNKPSNWLPVINSFESRLSKWKAHSLSAGGRLTLLNSVIDNLPTYYFSLYKAPASVICKLDAIRKSFYWSGSSGNKKISWVSWDKMTDPKNKGGLGLCKLRDFNLALLSKWWWRFKSEGNTLWKQVILAIHHSPRASAPLPLKRGASGVWNNINKISNTLTRENVFLQNSITGTLGDGNSIRFWLDVWDGNSPLKDRFPDLFKLEKNKNRSVASLIPVDDAGGSRLWKWSRPISSAHERIQWAAIQTVAYSFVLQQHKDEWIWNSDSPRPFSVKEVRKSLSSKRFGPPPRIFIWNKWAPIKVNIWGWRVEQNRLPTKSELLKRKINLSSQSCEFCDFTLENADHLLTACPLASEIWSLISKWCNIPSFFAFEVKDLFRIHLSVSQASKTRKKILHLIILTAGWSIWRARNDKLFSRTECNARRLFEEIKHLSFLWFSTRANCKILKPEWNSWCDCPL